MIYDARRLWVRLNKLAAFSMQLQASMSDRIQQYIGALLCHRSRMCTPATLVLDFPQLRAYGSCVPITASKG